MRILLIGDASGAYQSLHYGFHRLGVDCRLLLLSPPHVKVESALSSSTEVFFPYRWIRPFAALGKSFVLNKYDVISFAHRLSIPFRPVEFRYLDLPVLRKKAHVLSYTALGCDEIAALTYNAEPLYTACGGCEKGDSAYFSCLAINRPLHEKAKEKLIKFFDTTVIALPDYSHVEKMLGNSIHIPLPIRWESVKWSPPSFSEAKIKIVHTATRKYFKGTDIVEIAMQTVMKRHKNVEYHLVSGFSYEKYLEIMQAADIVIDQVWSHSMGMSGLLMLAMGKIVLSGNTEYGVAHAPWQRESQAINASPDPEVLAETICSLIESWHEMKDRPEKGLAYIKKYHDPRVVAQQYYEHWEGIISEKQRRRT